MVVFFVWNPLSQKSPEASKKNSNNNFYRSVKDEFPEWSSRAEGDPHEDPKAADGDDVVSSAGRDDESGNTLLHAIATAGQAHQRGDDHGGGDGGQYEAEHEADSPGQVEQEVGEYGHGHRLSEAGNEGCSDHHPA